jgi:hypothetical protein
VRRRRTGIVVVGAKVVGRGERNWRGGRRRRVNEASGEAGGGTLHLEFVSLSSWVVGEKRGVERRDCDDALEAIFTRRSRYFGIGSAISSL